MPRHILISAKNREFITKNSQMVKTARIVYLIEYGKIRCSSVGLDVAMRLLAIGIAEFE